MVLSKRYCVEYVDGTVECFRDGFWYTETGVIVKWSILAAIFLFFMAWFVGGYMHAKRRMRKGLPLMAYHRWLVPYKERQRWGQTPQNHFTFYAAQPYGQRPNGTYPEPPPMYNNDAPPNYVPPPPGATKAHPTQSYMEMQPQYGVPPPQPTGAYPIGGQQTGIVGGGRPDVENQNQNQELPPRPQQAKLAVANLLSRFRR
ncbi:hypothetical protein K469DRAFT_569101 [Zopfia rhizophila CBS 207.26]|uniref:Ubiquitin-protein ligase sel1 n=1 Tax=Zopfia rhizophila CBS 207.26 TaxID=1314779 RepID=A0A6A6E9N6_9PEZI|nr:hypothetical protein K469DRAFT_569101 [Zopfia rhizophila CBS 207.26]